MLSRGDRLRQSGDHQCAPRRGMRGHRCQPDRRRLRAATSSRATSRRAHEPHARRAPLRQRHARQLLLDAMLRQPGRSGRRGLRLHQVRRARAISRSRRAARHLARDSLRPVERHAGRWPVDARGRSTGPNQTVDMGEIATNQWQTNLYTRTFIDDNMDGVSQAGEAGIPLIPMAVRYRDGSLANRLQHGLHRHGQFQRDLPAVQLVCGRVRRDPLQEHRHARGLRRRRPRGRHRGLRPGRLSALRHLDHRPVPGQHRRARLAAGRPARARCDLLRQRRLRRQVNPERPVRQRHADLQHGQRRLQLHGHVQRPHRSAVGRRARAGRASPARTTSSNSARRPTYRARTAASAAM